MDGSTSQASMSATIASTTTNTMPLDMDVVVEVVSVDSEAELQPSSPELSVSPWPVIFVECDKGQTPLPSSPIQHVSQSRQSQRANDKFHMLFYGSEPDSDESDVEEMGFPFIPRVFRAAMETPLDADSGNLDAKPADEPAITTACTSMSKVPPKATDQPWNVNDFVWKAFPDPPILPSMRRERFSQSNVGPTTPCVDPYDIFIAIWDRKFMEHIALETNRYVQQVATQMIENDNLRPNSRIGRWVDTTADELYVYFGVVIAMGVVVKSRLEEYWGGTPDIFYTPGFSAHMSFNRFLLLGKCLHFANNDDMCALELDDSEAKLFKIQPVLTHLNMKFQSMYTPGQNIALDESLLQWKGCLDINQFIPSKAAAMGIKTYEICESQTGYLWRFEVQTPRSSLPQRSEDPLNESTAAIVLRLIHGLENKGYTLWMDDFYNSPSLARRLKAGLGFDCVGTLRTNRKFVPQVLRNLSKKNMHPGHLCGLTSGDVDVLIWRDNSIVSMISTYHGNATASIRGSAKPTLIIDYNIMMGGVDKKDQMLAMYSLERRRTKVWYKKFFKRLLNVSIFNSFIIHRQSSSSPLSHRNFRITLVNDLLSKHASAAALPPVTSKTRRIDVSHRLDEYSSLGNKRLRRRCVVCKKRVTTCCVGCSKFVCMSPCFLTMHS